MLTRLEIKGFKNLVDVDVRFGPVTYIAGPNGAGKSNVFDAIHLLSLLADKPFVEAAREVRGGADLRDLFTTKGDGTMQLCCEVLIPRLGSDDFGQPAEASNTYLRYELVLKYEERGGGSGVPRVRLEREQLSALPAEESAERLGFSGRAWLDSVIRASSPRTDFIATHDDGVVRLQRDHPSESEHAEGHAAFRAERLPRTVLSSAQNAEEHRTAALLRQEMRHWRQLQLEPSALRKADELQSPQSITVSGAHVAATLHRLATSASDPTSVYAGISNRLAELVSGVASVRVERDEGRRLLTLMMRDRNGVELPASSLSDGTLRFIALAVMESDPDATGLVCLEEPENGIHPLRIEAMLRLLADMATDPEEPVGDDNPLRQVVVSTHSPLVVANAPADDVVFAAPTTHLVGGTKLSGLRLRGLEGTWRVSPGQGISKGDVLSFLEPRPRFDDDDREPERGRRVRDVVYHPRQQLPLFAGES